MISAPNFGSQSSGLIQDYGAGTKKCDIDLESLFVCLFLLLYVPYQQLWSLRDGQLT